MSPGRAGLVALAAALGLVLVFLYVPHWLLTALPAGSRSAKAWLASGWVLLALAGCTYAGWRATARPATSPPVSPGVVTAPRSG
jgi:hypothetical protein